MTIPALLVKIMPHLGEIMQLQKVISDVFQI